MSSKASVEAVSELRKAVWRLSGSGMSYNKFWLVYGDKLDSLTKTTVKRTEALTLGHPIQGEAKPLSLNGFAETLASIMDSRGVTVRGLAETLSIDKSAISRMRTGKPVEARHFIEIWNWVHAAPQPPTPAGVREITDEMVEAAARAMEPMAFREEFTATDEWYELEVEGRHQALGRARAALVAALAAAKGAGE